MLDTDLSQITLDCDGVNTRFSFPFKVISPKDLKVYLVEGERMTELILTADYDVPGFDFDNGGDVVTKVVYDRPNKILIVRKPSLLQETSFRNLGAFFPGIHEDAFDRVYMVLQWLSDLAEGSIHEDPTLPGYWDFQDKQSVRVPYPTRMDGVANPAYVLEKIREAVGRNWGSFLSYWDGIVEAGVYEYTIHGADVTDEKAYRVVLDGIPQRPVKDFEIEITESEANCKIKFKEPDDPSTWPVGRNWWIVCIGKAVPVSDAPWYRYEEIAETEKHDFIPPVSFTKAMVFVDEGYKPTAEYSIDEDLNKITMKTAVKAGETFTAYLNIRLDQLKTDKDVTNPIERIKGDVGSWKTGPDVRLSLKDDFGGAKERGDVANTFKAADAVDDEEVTTLKQVLDLIKGIKPPSPTEVITFSTPVVVYPYQNMPSGKFVDIDMTAHGIPDGSMVNVNFTAYPGQGGTTSGNTYIYGLISHGDSTGMASRDNANWICAGQDEREDLKDYIILFAGSGQVQVQVADGKIRMSRTAGSGANRCYVTAAISSYIKGEGGVTPRPPETLKAVITPGVRSHIGAGYWHDLGVGSLEPAAMGANVIDTVQARGEIAGTTLTFTAQGGTITPYDWIYLVFEGIEVDLSKSTIADEYTSKTKGGELESLMELYANQPRGIEFIPYINTNKLTTAVLADTALYEVVGFNETKGALTPRTIGEYEIATFSADNNLDTKGVYLTFKDGAMPYEYVNITIGGNNSTLVKNIATNDYRVTFGNEIAKIWRFMLDNVGVETDAVFLQPPRENP
ncbi:hypothetical protein LCS78_17020 [Vibrio harveyi]|uniref:hypothetical protein n=1 Tax=Vibrio harveyi TaxID=669 RepID=UPI00237F312F|nr:hypothetical protein [Vibrio harveyi]HDM8068681.1 hypothetical protein [Vibrio harveyi]